LGFEAIKRELNMKQLIILFIGIHCAIAMNTDLDFVGVHLQETNISPATLAWAQQYVHADSKTKQKMQEELEPRKKEIKDQKKIIRHISDLMSPRLKPSLTISHPQIQEIQFGSVYRSASCECGRQECATEFEKETIEARCYEDYHIWDTAGKKIALLNKHFFDTPIECFIRYKNTWEKMWLKREFFHCAEQIGIKKATFHSTPHVLYMKTETMLPDDQDYYDDLGPAGFRYEIKKEKCPARLPIHLFAVSPDRNYLAVASKKSLNVWEINPISEINRFSLVKSLVVAKQITALIFNPNSNQLATALQENIYLWSVITCSLKKLACLNGHTGEINSLAFDKTGVQLASASREDGTARIWDLKQLKTDN